MNFFRAKVLVWPLVMFGAVLVVAIGASLALGAIAVPALGSLLGSNVQTTDSQVVTSVKRTQEVSLLSLSVQGITRATDDGKILGITVPGADKQTLLQYSFRAKLGIDGEKVDIQPPHAGEDSFVVTVPEFVFIGNDEVHFEDPIRQGGVLSWLKPDIETTQLVNEVLDEDAQQQYLIDNAEMLREGTIAYYTNIATSIDPGASLTFRFASDSSSGE